MSSNSKGKPPVKESPNEPFKRAVAGCLRAIARKRDLEIGYAAERPGIISGKARLPEPPRKLSAAEAAIVRGHADAIAFGRIFISNPDLPRRLRHGFPLTPYNRATFYGGEEVGYTDYPVHDELEKA